MSAFLFYRTSRMIQVTGTAQNVLKRKEHKTLKTQIVQNFLKHQDEFHEITITPKT